MSISKIQTGDKVKVISGNYKGLISVVTKVLKKIYVNGKIRKFVNLKDLPKIVKYRRKMVYDGQKYPGEMLQKDRKIDITNVQLVNEIGEITRSYVKVSEDGKKHRYYKKSDKQVVIEKMSKVIDKKKEKTTNLKENSINKNEKLKDNLNN